MLLYVNIISKPFRDVIPAWQVLAPGANFNDLYL